MGFRCGIVGLPNVGKSTLFNALIQKAAAEASNYPFCTIEPNAGRVPVPDPRVHEIRRIAGSAEVKETRLSFVDIAGLVKGASRGEGLGNKFLASIREVDAVIHVVRCFEDADVSHVVAKISPADDIATVETELMLSDLERLERRHAALAKQVQGGDKERKKELAAVAAVKKLLEEGKPGRLYKPVSAEEEAIVKSLQLITTKPVLFVANVEEDAAAEGNAYSAEVEKIARKKDAGAVTISAAIEAEIAEMPKAEQKDYLASLGLEETGLSKVIRAGYALLDLITFFTAGPREARAWTVRRGSKAPEAAGIIHSDFEKGFIRAEVIAYEDYAALGGEQGAKDAGKMRLEGKDYAVRDGDVIHFRFAV